MDANSKSGSSEKENEVPSLDVVFMGTPDFAVPSLDLLLKSRHRVKAVVTATDKLGGRGKNKLLESAVKKHAKEKGIEILQPPNLKKETFVRQLEQLGADLFVVVAFRMLPEVVWSLPPLGTINLHASLLPRYRGAAPINWAIIKGEKKTGLTTFQLSHEIDTGSLLFQEEIVIGPDETAGELHDRMMPAGAKLVLKTVNALAAGTARPKSQDASLVSHAPKIFHRDCEIDWDQPAQKVHDFVRGLSPYPAAWTTIDGKQVKIYRAGIPESCNMPGAGKYETDNRTYLRFGTSDGCVEVYELKMEGKRKMKIGDFLNGFDMPAEGAA